MIPNYDLKKIKFATDRATFEKAVGLYEGGKVKNFKDEDGFYSAEVQGGELYQVWVRVKRFGEGNCDCYMGQKDYFCKHMVALALYAVLRGKKLPVEETAPVAEELICSGQLGELTKDDLTAVKKEISNALRYIKAYNGPSRTWFAYQESLDEGCKYLREIFSKLPVSRQTSELVIKILLKIDDRLCRGGVDDSDGTVGGFIGEAVELLNEFVELDHSCIKSFKLLCQRSTCFGWEEPLVKILDEENQNTP